MKKLNKISILFYIILGFSIVSCETTDLNLLDDPNQVTLDKANLDRFLVAIQLDFKSFVQAMGVDGAQLTRIEQMGGRQYENAFSPATVNFEWNTAYQGMFSDMAAAENLAVDQEANKHLGVMRILKAYTLMTLVDFWGDVPFSQATQPSEFPNPMLDDDATVYAAAQQMLDEGIAFLQQEGLNLDTDFYYNNDFDKWIALANTLKMKSYITTRLVDGDAASKFNAIVNSGNYITSSAGDFQFKYGTSTTMPDTRHPGYSADYTVSGVGRYHSNYLMDLMYDNNDPRIRYYFYRQNMCTPNSIGADGNFCGPDQQRIPCSIESKPLHYTADMVFCSVDGGYWGWDHGRNDGIPPDSFRRTAVGVYPAGGNFDDDRFATVGVGVGGGGAGIVPIMMASFVDYMRAEFALINGDSGGANNLLQSAMQKSIAKVMTFGSLDPNADLSFAPSAADVTSYIAATGTEFAGTDMTGKFNILAEQQFIAHYGNGIDSYNFYRRTGYPTTLQFNLEPNPGGFIRSLFYPADEANTNSNVQQKAVVTNQVFWDNNPPSPGFPAAN